MVELPAEAHQYIFPDYNRPVHTSEVLSSIQNCSRKSKVAYFFYKWRQRTILNLFRWMILLMLFSVKVGWDVLSLLNQFPTELSVWIPNQGRLLQNLGMQCIKGVTLTCKKMLLIQQILGSGALHLLKFCSTVKFISNLAICLPSTWFC